MTIGRAPHAPRPAQNAGESGAAANGGTAPHLVSTTITGPHAVSRMLPIAYGTV